MEALSLDSVQNDHHIHDTTKSQITNFPREKSWLRDTNLYMYEGFWYYQVFLEQIIKAQKNFRARSTDIFVASHTKTGTTWLKALAFSIATRSPSFDVDASPLVNKAPHDCIPFLEIDLSEESSRDRESDFPLVATHIPYNSLPKSIVDSGNKIVYIWRDPKDVFISLWHFVDKTQKSRNAEPPIPMEKAFELFSKGVSNYGPYWDHVVGYWKAKLQFPDKILFLKYEEMKKDTSLYVKQLAEFIGYPFTIEEVENGVVDKIINMCSFENLSNLEVNRNVTHRANTSHAVKNNVYFRKGTTGDWKNELTLDMQSRIDAITEKKFSGLGLL